MEKAPIHLLEALSSVDEQRRYIIHATKEEYLLPEELLNNAFGFCEWVERHPSPDRSPTQSDAVAVLRASLDAVNLDGYDRTNIADLIERDAAWGEARKNALMTSGLFSG